VAKNMIDTDRHTLWSHEEGQDIAEYDHDGGHSGDSSWHGSTDRGECRSRVFRRN
jgi:hypothetical protein